MLAAQVCTPAVCKVKVPARRAPECSCCAPAGTARLCAGDRESYTLLEASDSATGPFRRTRCWDSPARVAAMPASRARRPVARAAMARAAVARAAARAAVSKVVMATTAEAAEAARSEALIDCR